MVRQERLGPVFSYTRVDRSMSTTRRGLLAGPYDSLTSAFPGLSKKEEDVRRRPDTLDGLRGRRARNVIEECKKMKGVARIIAMVSFYYYQSSLYGIL